MSNLTPAEVTALAEPVANKMSGTFGGVCRTCTAPRQVQFLYDDPLKTPATAVLTRFVENDSVLAEARSYHALNFGAQSGTDDEPPIRPMLGFAEQPDLPRTPIDIDTGDEATLKAVEEEAWVIEQGIVADLKAFEIAMAGALAPYVKEWNADGWLGAGGDFVSGVGSGLSSWWQGEKDFWGSALGFLKSTTAAVGSAVWEGVSNPIDTLESIAQTHMDVAKALADFMRGLLSGDIDKFVDALRPLVDLKSLGGIVGEFGTLVYDLFSKGTEFLNGLLEVFRRTPVLGLIANSVMRVVTLMTPNFWAEVLGKGTGFVIPEILMWVITLIISALLAATGAGAAGSVTLIGGRALSLVSKLRTAIKSKATAYVFMLFLETAEPIITKVGPLGKKLRESMYIQRKGVVQTTETVIIPMRYWIDRLGDLAKQGHGPQRHEGAVTDKQLIDRSLKGFDPMTGSVIDHDKFYKKYGVPYDPIEHGTPPDFGGKTINVPGKGELPVSISNKTRHVSGEHATKFNTPEDYVKAYDRILADPQFKAFENDGDNIQDSIEVNMSTVFGPDFQARIKGYDEFGNLTIFGSDTKIVAVFRKEAGGINLITMYPNP